MESFLDAPELPIGDSEAAVQLIPFTWDKIRGSAQYCKSLDVQMWQCVLVRTSQPTMAVIYYQNWIISLHFTNIRESFKK
jgi:hypothetical protein